MKSWAIAIAVIAAVVAVVIAVLVGRKLVTSKADGTTTSKVDGTTSKDVMTTIMASDFVGRDLTKLAKKTKISKTVPKGVVATIGVAAGAPSAGADLTNRTGDSSCQNRAPGTGQLDENDRNWGMGPYVDYNRPPQTDAPGWCGGTGIYGNPWGSLAYSMYNECCRVGTEEGHNSCSTGCCFDSECKPRSWCKNNGTHLHAAGTDLEAVHGEDGYSHRGGDVGRIDWKPPAYGPQGPNIGDKCDRDGFSTMCWYGCCKNGKCADMSECPGFDPVVTWRKCWDSDVNSSERKYKAYKDRG